MKDKIAILYNLNRGKFEYETEFDSKLTIDSICKALKENYEVIKVEAVKNFSWIKRINEINPKLVFNICEGFYGPAREAIYAGILEQFKYNYSGPDSTNLLICHNKFLVKNLVKEIVRVPFGYSVNDKSDISKIKIHKYPVIVKLNSEGSSMGLSEKSIVNNDEDLLKQIEFLKENYKRNILVEEYIDGIDISMAYIEGIGAMGPCQINCDSLFYDYEMKTIKDSSVDIIPMNGIYEQLKDIVMKIVKRLDIKGYAKLDFRMKNNKFYLIEVNSQVSFHPMGEFITCCKKDGYDFDNVINHIVKNALKSKQKINSVGIGEM